MASNKAKGAVVVLGLALIGGWFYWFQYRPTEIKKDCSWVHIQNAAVPAVPPDNSITDAQIDALENKAKSTTGEWWESLNASAEANALRKEKAGNPGKPAEDYWAKATDEQYDTCLRERGL